MGDDNRFETRQVKYYFFMVNSMYDSQISRSLTSEVKIEQLRKTRNTL
jgi:hypothetical protein